MKNIEIMRHWLKINILKDYVEKLGHRFESIKKFPNHKAQIR